MGKLRITNIAELANPIISATDELVEQYGGQLDSLITEISTLLNNKDDLTIEQLNYYIAEIPILLYGISNEINDLGVCTDLCKTQRRNKYNATMLSSTEGTVSQRTSHAQASVEEEQLMEDIYSRAYKKLQHRMEHAESLHNALKKILNYRISELEVTRQNIIHTNRLDRF